VVWCVFLVEREEEDGVSSTVEAWKAPTRSTKHRDETVIIRLVSRIPTLFTTLNCSPVTSSHAQDLLPA